MQFGKSEQKAFFQMNRKKNRQNLYEIKSKRLSDKEDISKEKQLTGKKTFHSKWAINN